MDMRARVQLTDEEEGRRLYRDSVRRTAGGFLVGAAFVGVVVATSVYNEADSDRTRARDVAEMAARQLGDPATATRSQIEDAVATHARTVGLLPGNEAANAVACGIVDQLVLQGHPGVQVIADDDCFRS